MATLATWQELEATVAKESDLTAEIPSASLILKTDNPANDVRAAKRAAWDDIRVRLFDTLPQIFHASLGLFGAPVSASLSWETWLTNAGYSYETLDGVLDCLVNPEELKQAFVARWIWRLYLRRQTEMIADGIGNVAAEVNPQLDFWNAEFEARLTRGTRALKLDLNADGVVTEWERTRTKTARIVRT